MAGLSIDRPTVERWTAVGVGLVGMVVAGESLTHDVGWSDAGPGSGYFPFRIGLLLVAGAAVLLAQQGRRAASVFATGEEFQRALGVFVPTAALGAGMFALGCYVPSAVYLAWMTRRHGGYPWLRAGAFGTAVAAAFFVLFEVWFRVPLAKGPLEAALGIY